jgi:hypothetical protein
MIEEKGGRHMDDHAKFQTLLEKLEENSRKQLIWTRVQCVFSIISGVCCIAVLIQILRFLPQLEQLVLHTDVVLSNLEAITQQLTALNLGEMVTNINGLVTTSQAGVEDALQKINEINFDALNQAVEDLAAVVQPLADFVKRITLGGLL